MLISDDSLLLERNAERAVLEAAVAEAAAGAGRVVLLDGPSGIGKTALLGAASQMAKCNGVRVLSARCAALETDFAFGVVRQLLEPALAGVGPEERHAALGGAASLASGVIDAGLRTDPLPGEGTSEILLATLNGLYWLTSNLAERTPLLLLVDDAQWSDSVSVRFFEFLARRIDELPVLLAMTSGPGPDLDRSDLLLQIAAAPRTVVLHPAPLGASAVGVLIRSALGAEPQDGFLAACQQATGGNPFLVRELLTELKRQDLPPGDERAEVVRSVGPRPVAQSLQLRLGRLPRGAMALAQAVTVLGDGTDLDLAAALAGLAPDEAASAADALAEAAILEPGSSLRFRHTIVRTALYAALPSGKRRQAHGRAAALQTDRGSPEQVAAHLLRTDPAANPRSVATLRRAATLALASGAPDVAATYLRRALVEPPTDDLRGQVVIELCMAAARQASPESFEELRRQMGLVDDIRQRAEIALELARAIGMVADMGSAMAVLEDAVSELGEADAPLGVRLAAELISVARLHPETRVSARERLHQLQPDATPDHLAGCVLLANLAMDLVERSQPAATAVALAEQALESGALLADERWVYAYAANTLTWADHTHAAHRAWTAAFERSNRRGSVTVYHLAAVWRSHLGFRCGDLANAEADARVALNICLRYGWEYSRSYALAFLVDVLVERGELDLASTLIADTPSPRPLHYLLDSIGRLHCAQGRPENGLGSFLECGNELETQGGGGNPAVIAWRSNAASALVALGRTDEARGLADGELEMARAFGAPRAIGVALRVRALLERGDDCIEFLDEALGVLDASAARLEYARALADRGSADRRAGRRSDAEERLRHALELAHRCGAMQLRSRIHDELLRSGLRPRRFTTTGADSLTASERRVADLAATSTGNREIAQTLYVSLKTVEAHLGSVYRKLGISSRAQLADKLCPLRSAGS